MNDALFNQMNWPEIETVVYSEHDNPHDILGPHITEEGVLIQVFLPTAKSVTVIREVTKDEYPMELVDDKGFYAVLIQEKKLFAYSLKVTYDNDAVVCIQDPYRFKTRIDALDMKRFNSGIHYDVYRILGAHLCEVEGIKGVSFAVWAPNAIRVSVVGDFNLWDGRRHPMTRHKESGIFELFIPEIGLGEIYKYEIKIEGGAVVLKADPYANYAEIRPNTASVVWNINNYQWNDESWLASRKKKDYGSLPMNIYEVHLGSFRRPREEGREFYNYRELAPIIGEYVLTMGYTHIEIMPIMEYPYDGSWGYQVTGYYAPTSRYGTPDDFMYFIDYMHQHGIGVILDWVPAHFPRDAHGLANFDGTCLYEHYDERQGAHPHWGTLIYNYGRPQVSNFLIANALFWLEKYHIDGIRSDAVASMLYLDYGKNDGEWIANMYGGNENLEAIEFFKHLNSIIHKREDGTVMIAEESTAWPKVTRPVEEEGLGFDLKWNMGWMNDFIDYMKCDPLFRKGLQGELTFSMIYAYSEKFILVLSHDEVVHEKGSMLEKMPGNLELKFANLRVAYGFMMTHPGKKLLFMGQEFGQIAEWSEAKELDWYLLEKREHKAMQSYVKDLNLLYTNYNALYEMDFSQEGFEWINTMDCERSILVYLRKSKKSEDTLLVVCNFTPVVYENYKVGVPFAGKYKEIFNSDKVIYGGEGNVNPRLKQSKSEVVDERPNSIKIKVPPMGVSIFSCTPSTIRSSSKAKKEKEQKVQRIDDKRAKGTESKSKNS